ncbi:24511_t:CDS:2, partial [Gigaspora margarita]
LQKKRHKHNREEINPDDQTRQIENINQLYQMQIPLIPNSWPSRDREAKKLGKSFKKEVKQQVTSHFQKQFRRRDQKFNEMNQEWQKEYEPKIDINPNWYKTVMSPIEDEEWA